MTRLYPGHTPPQFQELASKKCEQVNPGTEDELYLTKMTLVRPLMTNLKVTVRADCAVSACSRLLLSIKALAPLAASAGGVGLCPQLLASEIKQTLLSSNLAYLLASEQQAVGPLLCQ